MSSWRDRLYEKALADPQFFRQLVSQRDSPASLLESVGISLTDEEMMELQEVLAGDRVRVELDWDEVVDLAEEFAAPGIRGWRGLLGTWIGGGS